MRPLPDAANAPPSVMDALGGPPMDERSPDPVGVGGRPLRDERCDCPGIELSFPRGIDRLGGSPGRPGGPAPAPAAPGVVAPVLLLVGPYDGAGCPRYTELLTEARRSRSAAVAAEASVGLLPRILASIPAVQVLLPLPCPPPKPLAFGVDGELRPGLTGGDGNRVLLLRRPACSVGIRLRLGVEVSGARVLFGGPGPAAGGASITSAVAPAYQSSICRQPETTQINSILWALLSI